VGRNLAKTGQLQLPKCGIFLVNLRHFALLAQGNSRLLDAALCGEIMGPRRKIEAASIHSGEWNNDEVAQGTVRRGRFGWRGNGRHAGAGCSTMRRMQSARHQGEHGLQVQDRAERQEVTRYKDVNRTNYQKHVTRIVNVTRVQPITRVNVVTRVHNRTVILRQTQNVAQTATLPTRTITTGQTIQVNPAPVSRACNCN
jgi:hypothetical protein